jgi:hypothetical protein
MYGISATVRRPPTGPDWYCNPVRTGTTNRRNKGVNVMGIAILLFFLALAIASGAGLTYDSRDSRDWQPSTDGRSYRW